MTIVKLSDRALDDLDDIENYSIKQFGKKVADKYIGDIELGLNLLQENSGLLQEIEGFEEKLKFYRIRSHFFICTEIEATVVVLTIKHVQMDIINMLVKLEPTLVSEVDLFIRKATPPPF